MTVGSPRKVWIRAAIGVATVAVVAWLARGFDWSAWWLRLAALPAWIWALVPVGMAASYLCRAARVHAELSLRQPVSLWHCLRLSLVHNLAIHVVPMRGGELAYPALLQRELNVPLGSAVASLAWMRLQDALVLAAWAVWLMPLPLGQRLVLLALAAAGLMATVRWARRHATRWAAAADESAGRAERPEETDTPDRPGTPAAAASSLQRLLAVARRALGALTDPARHTAAGWLYCLGNWTLKLAVVGAVLAALTGLPQLAAWRGALGGELAALSPVQGPSGLGTYEAGVWLGIQAVGSGTPITTAAVALAALTAHALIFLTALAAGLTALAVTARTPRAPA